MGTRGFVGFVADGKVKIAYNHFDSYPGGLGVAVFTTVARWLSSGEIEKRVQQAQDLRLVTDDDKPTPEDWERLAAYRKEGRGWPGSWYELLRETQGDLDATLDAGVMIDAEEFALDSLFCEWGYLVDLDARKLEVYEGFRKEPPTAGRWVGKERSISQKELAELGLDRYHAVQRIVEFSLHALPGDEKEFLRVVEAHSRNPY